MESPIAKNVTDNQKKSRQNKKICRELEKEVASSPQKSREAKKRSRESKKKARGQKKSRCPFQATVFFAASLRSSFLFAEPLLLRMVFTKSILSAHRFEYAEKKNREGI